MTPDEARERFSAAYDGELSAEEQRAFDALVDEHPDVRAEWNELRRALDEAHALAADDAGGPPVPDLLPGVQGRIRERSRGRFYRDRFSTQAGPRATLPLVLALIMLLVVGLAWLLLDVVDVSSSPPGAGVETREGG